MINYERVMGREKIEVFVQNNILPFHVLIFINENR